ncbi:MAG: translation elongation factor Ts [Planctomycetaceae bacterium]
MAEITAEAVRALRERTDLPMMECKKALAEAGGDQEKAVQILKERVKGLKLKVADRMTSEGRVATRAAADGSAAVMIEIQCESAPVAKSEDFLKLCDQLTKQLLSGPGAATVDELLAQKCPDNPGQTLRELHEEVLNKIRENIVIARLLKLNGPVAAYTHHDGTLGVLFQAEGGSGSHEVLRDVAMHIAAVSPAYCLPEQLPAAVVTAERDRLTAEAKASGKPEAIVAKMVDGKMRIFYSGEGVLTSQPFAKDDSKTVEAVLANAGHKAVGFTRWRLGRA